MTSRVIPGSSLLETGVVAVVRSVSGVHTAAVLDTLAGAGVRCMEVTMNTPGALDEIRSARERLPASIEIGAGTVMHPDQADAAVDAGASFVVAPNIRQDVAVRAGIHGIGYYPGALTPNEIASAWELGASAVKVFPAGRFGPGYLRELRGPFRDIPLLPTGGVGIGAAGDYIAAGAFAVGVGGPLTGDALDGGDLNALRERALRLLASIAKARS